MKKIDRLKDEDIDIVELIEFAEQVRKNGDTIAMKLDGARLEVACTVFITFPTDKNRDMIRFDSDDFSKALVLALREYFNI